MAVWALFHPKLSVIVLAAIFCSIESALGQDDKPAGNQMGSGNTMIDMANTPYGQVKGMPMTSRTMRPYVSFMSIPYARTPMMFEPAEPPMPWPGVLDGTKPSPMCPQASGGDNPEFMGQVDCLYMAVHSPHEALVRTHRGGPLYPVIVVIPAAFTTGSGDMHGPQYFMDEDVVLVTMNSRLGALGFLSTGDGEILGNMGLKDQVLALKWVQQNIQFFGGDPRRVTLMGIGAGAVSAQLHMLSPMSSGLFQHVIAHSGSALSPWGLSKNPAGTAQKFGMRLGCNSTNSRELALCLKAKDVKDIVMAQAMYLDWNKDPLVPFPPTVEVRPTFTGYVHPRGITFLPEHPYAMIRQGNFYKAPMITGFTKDEGLLRAELVLGNAKAVEEMNAEWNRIAPLTLLYDDLIPNPHHKDYVSARIKEFYFGNKMIGPEVAMNLTNMYSDRYYLHSIQTAAFNFAHHAPVYPYHFSFQGSMSMLKNIGVNEIKGVAHTDDMFYFFKLMNMDPLPAGSAEENFSKKVIKLWVSFAYSGKPTDSWISAMEWLPVQPSETVGRVPTHYYDLNMEFRPIMSPFTNRMHFWNHLIDTDLRDELYFVPYRYNHTFAAPPPHSPYRRHY